ncbi:MAG TPA: DUF4276 family protein [Longimicrobium sp.]|jgi:hypothetical protein|uniref:DUF4276 family protein n=1 Tax=Longimicrobium sp. TaxID=2029185 RepID=UPI002ED7D794
MCGSRESTYEDFRMAVREHTSAVVLMLVDAEAPVTQPEREHLLSVDGWDLSFARQNQIHLMAQMMESWFLADPDALQQFYGHGFRVSALPASPDVEQVPKNTVEKALASATRQTRPGAYHKTKHAPQLLANLSPARVRARAPRCDRLFWALQSYGR